MSNCIADSWLEIDLEAIRQNIQAIKALLNRETEIMAVVKANAYGHGAVKVAHFLEDLGIQRFAVTFLQEALELRDNGIRGSILLLAPLASREQVIMAIDNNITMIIASPFDACLIGESSRDLKRQSRVHLKIDTGLGRFGLNEAEVLEVCRHIKDYPDVYVEGIYTHMAEGSSATYTEKQFGDFMNIVGHLDEKGYNFPLKHCANSAVFLKYPHMHLDLARIGTLIYGHFPAGISYPPLELKDPFIFKSRVISVRNLKAGSCLGYFRTYRLKKDAKIAVIPVGFNDGLALEVKNPPAGFMDLLKIICKVILQYLNFPRFVNHVRIKGISYPVRGKVFMQLALVELSPQAEVMVGDEVEVPVRKTLLARDKLREYIHDKRRVQTDNGE